MSSEMSEQTRGLASVIGPLQPDEERAAIEVATTHLAKSLSGHHRVLGGELRIGKPAEHGRSLSRIVAVLVVDYGNRRILDVLVDRSGTVVEVVDLRGAQPAYTNDEIAEARAIAEADGRVADLASLTGSFVSQFGPERAPDNARRVGLRYARIGDDQRVRVLAHAIVDLAARRLVQLNHLSGDSGSEE